MDADSVHDEILKNWPEFADRVMDFDVGSPENIPFAFRGQPVAGCKLYPSLVRHAIEMNLNPEDALMLERTATAEFRRQALIHLPNSVIPDRSDIVGWWTLMQHYGAPTRLLDWTASPFVAAYFAAESDFDRPGEIWAVFAPGVVTSMKRKGFPDETRNRRDVNAHLLNPNAPRALYFMVPNVHTDRMAAQQTAFSYSAQILANHGEIITDALVHEIHPRGYRRLIIEKGLKVEFLRQLRRMNITGRALFPGIDGLGRSVSELIRLTAHHRFSGTHPNNA